MRRPPVDGRAAGQVAQLALDARPGRRSGDETVLMPAQSVSKGQRG